MQTLKQTGVELVAVEIHKNSQSIINYQPAEQVAYILGNEVEGVSEEVLSGADEIRHVPMLGKKESLNVSVTAGIIMYHDFYKK